MTAGGARPALGGIVRALKRLVFSRRERTCSDLMSEYHHTGDTVQVATNERVLLTERPSWHQQLY
eukprot:8040234-Pyramimonas_sp.AAC.1